MKLSSKNSFLKRLSCIALSLMLCLTSFTLSGFVPTLEAEAATNANITVSGYGVLIGDGQNRITDNALTIVNDQQDTNFSVGFVEFDLSSIDISSLKENKSVVTSANYTFSYSIGSSEREAMGLSCYYSTQNDSELVGTGAKINSGTAKDIIFTGDDGAHISRAVSHFGLKKIADYNTKVNSSATYTVNLTTMINYAIQNNRTKVRLIIMLKQPGGLNGQPWTDTIVTVSKNSLNATFDSASSVLQAFEAKMDGSVYTNMDTAYNAYVEASKAYDAFYYGGNTAVDVATPAVNLNNAVSQMNKINLTAYTANNSTVPTFGDGDNGTVGNSYVNLLYTSTGTQHTLEGSDTGDTRYTFQVGYNNTVMMYDGTAPRTRVMYSCQVPGRAGGSRKYRNPMTCYPTTGKGQNGDLGSLYLVDKWKGGNNGNWDFPSQYNSPSYTFGHNSTTISAGRQMQSSNTGLYGSDWYAYSNILEFNSNYNWNGSYLASFENVWWASYSGNNAKSNLLTDDSSTSIYVINYKPLKDAINTDANSAARSKVASYKEGGLSTYLTGCLLAANLNPNSYSYSTDLKGQASQCATDISNAVTKFTASPSADNTNNYPALRKAMDKAMSTYKAGMSDYTYRSYNQFKTAYESAQNVMKNVIKNGYNDGSSAKKAAENLNTAFEKLETPKANITFENLFSFDDFYNSSSASEKTSLGEATYNRSEKTITTICNVEGNNDNYTSHDDLPTLYKIPVTAGKTYFLEFTADNENADAMIFVPNDDETGFDKNYVMFRGGHVNGHNRIEITVPDGKNYVYFRFGSTNVFNVSVTFSNIVFYEADREAERGNLTVTEKSVTPGQPYGDLPTPERDGYVFKGWFADKEFTKPITAETIAVAGQSATNLYAKWHAHNYVTTISDNGNNYYTWTKNCSCGDTQDLGSVDASAYLSAVAAAQTDIENTVKYSAASIAKLQDVLNANNLTFDNEHVLTQDDIKTATANIITADKLKADQGVLELKQYTVTFTYVDTDGNEKTEINAVKYDYGASVDLTVPDEAGQVYKWNKRIESADKKIAGSTNHITHIVSDNVTISAYTVQQKKPDTQYCVTVYNRINKVIGYFYVNKDAPVSFDGPTITVGDNSLTVEKTPYYQIDGFMCNGQPIGTGFTVTSDVKIYPIYSAQNQIEITLNNNSGNAQITFDDGTTETKKALWDQKVTVKADSEVTWYVGDVAVAKGNKYTFRATESITIKAVADATETGSSIITYANFDSENRKARIAVSSYSSNNKVIQEQGLIILTSTSTSELSKDDIKKNGKMYKATNTTSEGNQFSFTLNVGQSSSIKTFGIISYVKYKDGTTYYSTECKNIHVI